MMNEKWEEQFREQIHDFVETIEKFDKGEIDRKAYKGISGGFGSYAQRDPSKHMLRLRMAGGNLTEKRLEFLTEAVKDYGVELMKLTTCETVQLHNLKAEQVPVLMEKAIACRDLQPGRRRRQSEKYHDEPALRSTERGSIRCKAVCGGSGRVSALHRW